MDKLKQWVALTVLACMAVTTAGWFLLVSPKRAEAQDLRDQAAAQESTNATLLTQLAMLKAQAKDLPAEQAKLAAVAAKIPDNPALPALIRSLDGASVDAGVELVSIAPGAAAPVAVADPAAPAPASGLASIPVAINVVGGYFEVQQFLSSLEGLSRALRVTSLSLAPGANPVQRGPQGSSAQDGRSLSATISGQVYMAADTPVAPAAPAAVPAVPAN